MHHEGTRMIALHEIRGAPSQAVKMDLGRPGSPSLKAKRWKRGRALPWPGQHGGTKAKHGGRDHRVLKECASRSAAEARASGIYIWPTRTGRREPPSRATRIRIRCTKRACEATHGRCARYLLLSTSTRCPSTPQPARSPSESGDLHPNDIYAAQIYESRYEKRSRYISISATPDSFPPTEASTYRRWMLPVCCRKHGGGGARDRAAVSLTRSGAARRNCPWTRKLARVRRWCAHWRKSAMCVCGRRRYAPRRSFGARAQAGKSGRGP